MQWLTCPGGLGKHGHAFTRNYQLVRQREIPAIGVFEVTLDFIARLAALVPKPRVNLTRFHGVLAPNHRWRGLVTPARRGKGTKTIGNSETRSPTECHAAMTWAQRLKRVFSIDIEICGRCGGTVKVNANPTFEWIRLAQRVPVRVHLDPLPKNVQLRVGTTASVLIRTGTAASSD